LTVKAQRHQPEALNGRKAGSNGKKRDLEGKTAANGRGNS